MTLDGSRLPVLPTLVTEHRARPISRPSVCLFTSGGRGWPSRRSAEARGFRAQADTAASVLPSTAHRGPDESYERRHRRRTVFCAYTRPWAAPVRRRAEFCSTRRLHPSTEDAIAMRRASSALASRPSRWSIRVPASRSTTSPLGNLRIPGDRSIDAAGAPSRTS
jgi:hypothetical protein